MKLYKILSGVIIILQFVDVWTTTRFIRVLGTGAEMNPLGVFLWDWAGAWGLMAAKMPAVILILLMCRATKKPWQENLYSHILAFSIGYYALAVFINYIIV